MIIPYLQKKLHPALFQGSLRKKNYFEGWYFKQISGDHENMAAFIPGISLSRDSHAFVQHIDGLHGRTSYFRFPLSTFKSNKNKFEIEIDKNYFSDREIVLDLKDQACAISGKLRFSETTGFPVSLFSPGIMGWYSYVPFMECYHGVVSVNHSVQGTIKVNDTLLPFDHGKGYIEKDWGRSFPSDWIWLQANCFAGQTTSLMLSIAKIPWLGRSFLGFLSFFYIDRTFYRFATYTGATIDHAAYRDNTLSLVISDKKYRVEVRATHAQRGDLRAPQSGAMSRTIKESINAELEVLLYADKNQLLYSGKSPFAGLEVEGDIIGLLNKNKF
jgi:tocopherol cyclase